VLLLDQGQLTAPPVMRALKRGGARVTLAVEPTGPRSAARSRFVDAVVPRPSLADGPRFVEFVARMVREGAEVLMPMGDHALLALQPLRRELEGIIAVAAPPAECVAVALDKGRTIERARGIGGGLTVPVSTLPETAEEAADTWPGRFPVIVKPRVGTDAAGVRSADDLVELRQAFACVTAGHGPALVQEAVDYRPGDKFVLLYLFDHRGELCSWYAQRVERERHSIRRGAGSASQCGGSALLWRSSHDPDPLRRGEALLRALGWRGLASIEGAYDRRDGRPYLFEINPRLDGTGPLALGRGTNLVHDACLVALRRTPARCLDHEAGRRARKNLFMMLEARDLRLALAVLDPRYAPPLPIRQDPVPVALECLRLLRKHVRVGTRAWGGPPPQRRSP
jgi:predicted ATP-grasp superfamily ATP-dependent carboligase